MGQKGAAPIAPKVQWNGKLNTFILHHKKPIHDDGGLYDLDNLYIVTPKMHKEILDPRYHFNIE